MGGDAALSGAPGPSNQRTRRFLAPRVSRELCPAFLPSAPGAYSRRQWSRMTLLKVARHLSDAAALEALSDGVKD